MSKLDENLKLKLKKDLDELAAAVKGLEQSYKKCKNIGAKEKYTFEEQESFDSFSSKIARCSDIFTQKILKTIFLLVRENPKSFIDRANLAEKLDIIPSAEELIEIRDLRNEIVHEYVLEELKKIYQLSLLKYPVLISAVKQAESFINQKKLV